MPASDVSFPEVGQSDIIFGVVAIVCIALIIPVQVISMITFDSTALDTIVTPVVFMGVIPAGVIALIPAVLGLRRYSRTTALGWSAGLFLAYLFLAVYLMQFYGACGGPPC